MRRLLIVAVGALVLLAAYLQTADGFRRIVLPAFAAGLGAECTARSGRLRLNGSLVVDGLTYRDAAAGVDFAAERLEAQVGLASLLSGRPRILRADLRGGALRVEARPTDDAAENEPSTYTLHDYLRVHFPVDIERATASEFTLDLARGASTRVRLGPLRLELHGALPASTARLELSTGLALAPGDVRGEYTGNGRATLRIEQTAASELRRWTLDAEVDLQQAAAGAFQFTIASRGTVAKRSATASLHLAGRRGTEALGAIEAKFEIPAAGTTSSADELSGPRVNVELRTLTTRFLAPFVAALGDAHLVSGQLDGSVRIQPAASGDAIDVRAELDGRDLRLARGGASDTPTGEPLRLRLSEDGTWYFSPRRLELRAAAASLARADVTVLALQVFAPTAISFADASSAAGAQPAPHSARARIDGLPLAVLADWLALAGVVLPAPLAAATLDGELLFGAPAAGSPIMADGRVTARGVAVDPSVSGLSVSVTGHAAIEPARGAQLERVAVQLEQQREPLALVHASGSLGWSTAPPALDVILDVPDLAGALGRAGFAPPDALRAGRLRAQGKVSKGSEDLQLDATVNLAGVSVRGPRGGIDRDVSAITTLRVDADTIKVSVRDLRTTDPVAATFRSPARPGGAPPATTRSTESCSAEGALSLAPDGESRFDVHCSGVLLAPWLELAVSGWSAVGPTPLDSTVAVQFGGQGPLRIDGRHTVQVRDLDGRPFAVELTNAIRRRGQITEFELAVQSSRSPPDRATLTGSLENITRPQLRVVSMIDSADLTPLAPVFEAQREMIERVGAEVAHVVRNRALHPADLPRLPLDVTAEIELGRVRYRGIQAESGRVSARLYNTRWDIDMTPTGLAGGRVSGHFDRSIEAWHETIGFTAHVAAVGLSELSSPLRGGEPAQLDGALTIEADLRGRSASDANILDAMKGTLGATLDRGRVHGFNPLQFLADRTGVKQLARIPLDTFAFRANANVERGIVHLDQAVVVSAAAHYEISGRVTPDGQVDLAVVPLVGPSLAQELSNFGLLQRVVGAVEGLAALPIRIRIRGPIENPRYTAEPTTPKVVGTTAGIVGGAAKEVGGMVDGVTGLFGK